MTTTTTLSAPTAPGRVVKFETARCTRCTSPIERVDAGAWKQRIDGYPSQYPEVCEVTAEDLDVPHVPDPAYLWAQVLNPQGTRKGAFEVRVSGPSCVGGRVLALVPSYEDAQTIARLAWRFEGES